MSYVKQGEEKLRLTSDHSLEHKTWLWLYIVKIQTYRTYFRILIAKYKISKKALTLLSAKPFFS